MTLPRPAEGLSWAIKVSLLGTPIVRRQLSGVLGLSFLFVALLLTLIFALDGTWEGLLLTLGVVVLVYLMLSVLALLVILVFFGNRIGMQFSLDSSGARSLITESRAEKAAQLALLLGLLTGNFAVAGAGALARSGAHSFVAWKRVERVEFDDMRRTLYLRDSWHTLAALFCNEENYAEAKAWALSRCRR